MRSIRYIMTTRTTHSPLLRLSQAESRHPQRGLSFPLDLTLYQGETVVLIGDNAIGKTTLCDMITGALPLRPAALDAATQPLTYAKAGAPLRIASLSFRDTLGVGTAAYYQQRYNQGDPAEQRTVRQVLATCACPDAALRTEILQRLHLTPLLEKSTIALSSGETRRLQLGKALLQDPELLIIDNPYIGLDAPTRIAFDALLQSCSTRLTLLLVVCQVRDIPSYAQRILHLTTTGLVPYTPTAPYTLPPSILQDMQLQLQTLSAAAPALPLCQDVARLHEVGIRYGERIILSPTSWHVRQGEHWCIMGRNGAGKSTLLSLLLADHPQAYACNLSLFGQRRGTGESIWDIKRHIGYVSPELHRTCCMRISTEDLVAGGLHDTLGLYKTCTAAERRRANHSLQLLGIGHLAMRDYTSLSSGQQHMALLARAFVKCPALLVLDEPLHALDAPQRARALAAIQCYASLPGRTLIMVSHYAQDIPPCITHTLHLGPSITTR